MNQVRILVVEDQLPHALILENDLTLLGIEVDVASDGLQAIEKIEKDSRYNAIIMDICMPRMNGYEATKRIREFNYDRPIIGFSSFHGEEDIKKGLDIGMNAYLAKEANIKALVELLYDLNVLPREHDEPLKVQ